MTDPDPGWYARYREEVEREFLRAKGLLWWLRNRAKQPNTNTADVAIMLKIERASKAISTGLYEKYGPIDNAHSIIDIPTHFFYGDKNGQA